MAISRTSSTQQSWRKSLEKARKLIDSGRSAKARDILQELSADHPEVVEIRFSLGVALLRSDDRALALEVLSEVVEQDPENPMILAWFGDALRICNRRSEAIRVFEKALELDPDNAIALGGLGGVYTPLFKFDLAIPLLRKAVGRHATQSTLINLCFCLVMSGKAEEGLAYGYRAIKCNPDSASVYAMLGDLQQQLGNRQEAVRLLRRAIALDPTLGSAYKALAESKKFTEEDRPLVRKMEDSLSLAMAVEFRQQIHFSLGKIYNDLRDWDRAFEHYDQGNQLMHTAYDPTSTGIYVKKMKRFFSPALLQRLAGLGVESEIPVFVLGMPRSGSTLVEQVLSSHSLVATIGESMRLDALVKELCVSLGQGKLLPNCLKNVTGEHLVGLAEQYLETARDQAGDKAVRIIDKMPFNYWELGLISLVFPQAKVIHTTRHPLDTCLSCYFQRFTASDVIGWTTRLEQLGRYYRCYAAIMEHWRKLLPIPILEVPYEDMVEDFETCARRIVEFCGLDWEPQCLEFHKSKRAVHTASVMQVRQPIYKTSKARWIPYAKHLGPLVESLGDVLTEEDYAALNQAGLNARRPSSFSLRRLMSRG